MRSALLRKHFDEQVLAILGPRDAEINKTVKPKQTQAPKADVRLIVITTRSVLLIVL